MGAGEIDRSSVMASTSSLALVGRSPGLFAGARSTPAAIAGRTTLSDGACWRDVVTSASASRIPIAGLIFLAR